MNGVKVVGFEEWGTMLIDPSVNEALNEVDRPTSPSLFDDELREKLDTELDEDKLGDVAELYDDELLTEKKADDPSSAVTNSSIAHNNVEIDDCIVIGRVLE